MRGFDCRPFFFSHIQCLGAVCGFWLFYKGGKGPYLGVFPILQYKRPQGEEDFFLGIRMAVTWVGCLGCFVFQGPNLLAQFPTKAQVNRKRVELKRNFVKFRVPGVMKVGENCSISFLRSFLYPGS